MKCKNKEIEVMGFVYDDKNYLYYPKKLRVICTNDEKGKTLSVDNGVIQFTVPMEQIAEFFKGDYRGKKQWK